MLPYIALLNVNLPDMDGFVSYIAFGKVLGYMNAQWIDVHGAGSQRRGPKTGDPANWPQGDAVPTF